MNCLSLRLQKLHSLVRPMLSMLPIRTTPALVAQLRQYNANRSSICKISRTKYCRLYRVVLVYPDGSTITVRHPEPQSIVQLPLLLEDCKTETERREWLSRRKRIEIIRTEDEFDVNYSHKQYLNIFKNKSKSRAQ